MDKLRAHGSPDLGLRRQGRVPRGDAGLRAQARPGSSPRAEKGSLADDAHFAADTASLGSEEVVTAWADASRLSDLLRQQLQATLGGMPGALGGVDPLGGLSGLGGIVRALKGRFVMGMHATNDSVEMRVRSFGGTPAPASPPVRLQHVVAEPVAVLAVSGYGKSLAAQWSTLASSPMYQSLADQAKLIGLDLPGDLEKLLGDQLTASLSGRGLDEPQWVVAATSGDPAAGKAVLDRLLALAGPDAADLPVSTRVDGDTLYVGSSAEDRRRCGHHRRRRRAHARRAVPGCRGEPGAARRRWCSSTSRRSGRWWARAATRHRQGCST